MKDPAPFALSYFVDLNELPYAKLIDAKSRAAQP
jgi:hypothetical protein